MKNTLRRAFLHSAGATVSHDGRFAKLDVPSKEDSLSKEFILKWVTPFYSSGLQNDSFATDYHEVRNELTVEITLELLSEFNWRPRIVGAYFAAIERYDSLEDIIGKLLLRSDVCFAGTGYCLALATFGSEESIQFLRQYLDYYLRMDDLWFDQGDAMAAIAYLDRQKGTDVISDLMPLWTKFVKNKNEWNLDSYIQSLDESMSAIEVLRRT